MPPETRNDGNCSIHADVFGREEPAIRDRFSELYSHFSWASVFRQAGADVHEFLARLRVADVRSAGFCEEDGDASVSKLGIGKVQLLFP
jgi:hypothetical protein